MVDRRGQIFLPKNRLCSCQNGFPLFFHCKLYFKTLNLQQCLILSWTLCRNTKFYMLSKNKTGFETDGSVVNLNLVFSQMFVFLAQFSQLAFFKSMQRKLMALFDFDLNWFWQHAKNKKYPYASILHRIKCTHKHSKKHCERLFLGIFRGIIIWPN